jgi:hypothetical protein
VATPHPREQEQSIKARKKLLFDDDEDAPAAAPRELVVRKPFREYLQTTPAAPLSGGVKAALWAAGVVVLLLLIAALLTIGG